MPIGGIVSAIINAADPGSSGKKYLKKGLKEWQDLSLPEYEQLIAPYLQSTGQMTPEIYDAVVRGQFRGIEEDPYAETAQLRNLGRLEEIAREGMPLQDRLAADEAQRAVAQEGSRAREQIISNLARRGRGGSGAELAAKLASAGQQEEMARGMGSDIARMLLDRRLAAIGQMGGELGAYRGQNIGKEAQIAQMQNRYNEFLSNLNTQAAADAARARQAAQQYNLANQQRIADENVMNRYQTQLARNVQQQQGFQDRLAKTQGITGQYGQLSNLQNALQAQKQARVQAAGAGVDSLLNSVISSQLPTGGGA